VPASRASHGFSNILNPPSPARMPLTSLSSPGCCSKSGEALTNSTAETSRPIKVDNTEEKLSFADGLLDDLDFANDTAAAVASMRWEPCAVSRKPGADSAAPAASLSN
jgi:hypothetical protein